MILVYIAIWSFMLICGASAVWGLIWAIHAGQFRNFQQGASSIFDASEPIGRSTDSFPKGKRR